MLEAIVEQDDAIFEKYLGGEELSEEEIKKCIRKGTIAYAFVPITIEKYMTIK